MSKKIIPFFSAMKINSVDDYERFLYIKAYIRSLSSKIQDCKKLTPELRSLMKRSGHGRFTKFRKLRKDYDNLIGFVPYKYLDAIGVEMEELKRLLVLDQENYDQALKLCLKPRFGTIRAMAAIYNNIEIPEGMIEKDAIEYMRKIARGSRCRCCINYPSLKTIWIDPEEEVRYSYYRPEILYFKKDIYASTDGAGIGTSRIG